MILGVLFDDLRGAFWWPRSTFHLALSIPSIRAIFCYFIKAFFIKDQPLYKKPQPHSKTHDQNQGDFFRSRWAFLRLRATFLWSIMVGLFWDWDHVFWKIEVHFLNIKILFDYKVHFSRYRCNFLKIESRNFSDFFLISVDFSLTKINLKIKHFLNSRQPRKAQEKTR